MFWPVYWPVWKTNALFRTIIQQPVVSWLFSKKIYEKKIYQINRAEFSCLLRPGKLIISLLLSGGFDYWFKIFTPVFFPTFVKLRARPQVPEYFFPSPSATVHSASLAVSLATSCLG